MPLKFEFGADGQLETDRTATDLGLDLLDATEEVGADLVHLVDKHDPRNAIFVGLAPDGLRLRLDTLVAVEHAYRAVEHAQRPLDLDREVDVARRIDNVEALVLPDTSSSRRT